MNVCSCKKWRKRISVKDIRPYIDKYVAQVLDELTEAGCPLFLKTSRLDNFYKNQRLMLKSVPLRALLKFERTGEFYPLYFAFDRWRKDLLSQ